MYVQRKLLLYCVYWNQKILFWTIDISKEKIDTEIKDLFLVEECMHEVEHYPKKYRWQEILNLSACAVSSTDTIEIQNDLGKREKKKSHVSSVMCYLSPVTCPGPQKI